MCAGVVAPPPALAPPEVEAPEVPDVPEEPVPDDVLPPVPADVLVLDEPVPLVDAEVDVVCLAVVTLDELPAVVEPPAGTVSGGAATALAAADEPPPPQAESPSASNAPTASASAAPFSRPRPTSASGAEWLHPAAAVGAIVQILLSELVAPVAEPQVLDRPGKLRLGRGERQQHGHDLERLAGLAVDVNTVWLRLDHDLAAGRWRAHPVLLMQPHGRDATSGACCDGPRVPYRRGVRAAGPSDRVPRVNRCCGGDQALPGD